MDYLAGNVQLVIAIFVMKIFLNIILNFLKVQKCQGEIKRKLWNMSL